MPKKVRELKEAAERGEIISLTGPGGLAEAIAAESAARRELDDELDARIRVAGGPQDADLAEIIANPVVIGLARAAGLSGVTDKGGTTLMSVAQKVRREIEKQQNAREGVKPVPVEPAPAPEVTVEVVQPPTGSPITVESREIELATDAATFLPGRWVPIFDATLHQIKKVASPKMARMVCNMPEAPHFDKLDTAPPEGVTKMCRDCLDGGEAKQPTPEETGSVISRPAASAPKVERAKRERQKVEPAKLPASTDPKHSRMPAPAQTTPRRVAVRIIEGADPWQQHPVKVARWFHTPAGGVRVVNSVSHLLRADGKGRCGLPLGRAHVWTDAVAPVTCTNCRKTLGLLPVSYDEARSHMAHLPEPESVPAKAA